MSFQSSGSRSTSFVCQSNFWTLTGNTVSLIPRAKSSISIPTEAARKALEHEAMSKRVYSTLLSLRSACDLWRIRRTYVRSHLIIVLCLPSECAELDVATRVHNAQSHARHVRIFHEPLYERRKFRSDDLFRRANRGRLAEDLLPTQSISRQQCKHNSREQHLARGEVVA